MACRLENEIRSHFLESSLYPTNLVGQEYVGLSSVAA